jgi:predicted Fe-S protein YdhL (DUF1289 family)
MLKVAPPDGEGKYFYSATGPYFAPMSSTVSPCPQPPRPVATPCVKVCIVDGASGLCLGCWRTLSEIGGWSGLSDEQRAAIMAELPAREASGSRQQATEDRA